MTNNKVIDQMGKEHLIISLDNKDDEYDVRGLLWETGGMFSRYSDKLGKVIYAIDDKQLGEIMKHRYSFTIHEGEEVFYTGN